jgi:SAM-dependent methyltransferase
VSAALQDPQRPSAEDDRVYFDTLAAYADKHWWHRARRELAAAELRRRSDRMRVAVDAGCGAGGMLPVLVDLGASVVVGVEPSTNGLRVAARGRGRAKLVCAVAERLPLADARASALVSMDVVEHIDDDLAAITEYARVLEPGGTLLLQVPAYRWLWSRHDELVGHRRRYTARSLASAVRSAGLEVRRLSYYNAWLLPLAILVRRTPLQRLVRDSGESASYVHPALNWVLLALCRLERAILRRATLPFGVSILLVARRPS